VGRVAEEELEVPGLVHAMFQSLLQRATAATEAAAAEAWPALEAAMERLATQAQAGGSADAITVLGHALEAERTQLVGIRCQTDLEDHERSGCETH
jgi:hypothetical protein